MKNLFDEVIPDAPASPVRVSSAPSPAGNFFEGVVPDSPSPPFESVIRSPRITDLPMPLAQTLIGAGRSIGRFLPPVQAYQFWKIAQAKDQLSKGNPEPIRELLRDQEAERQYKQLYPGPRFLGEMVGSIPAVMAGMGTTEAALGRETMGALSKLPFLQRALESGLTFAPTAGVLGAAERGQRGFTEGIPTTPLDVAKAGATSAAMGVPFGAGTEALSTAGRLAGRQVWQSVLSKIESEFVRQNPAATPELVDQFRAFLRVSAARNGIDPEQGPGLIRSFLKRIGIQNRELNLRVPRGQPAPPPEPLGLPALEPRPAPIRVGPEPPPAYPQEHPAGTLPSPQVPTEPPVLVPSEAVAPVSSKEGIIPPPGEVPAPRELAGAVMEPKQPYALIVGRAPWQLTRGEFNKSFAGGVVDYIENLKSANAKDIKELTSQMIEAGLIGKEHVGPAEAVSVEGKGQMANPLVASFATLKGNAYFAHRDTVVKALSEGKQVPEQVMKSVLPNFEDAPIGSYPGEPGYIQNEGQPMFGEKQPQFDFEAQKSVKSGILASGGIDDKGNVPKPPGSVSAQALRFAGEQREGKLPLFPARPGIALRSQYYQTGSLPLLDKEISSSEDIAFLFGELYNQAQENVYAIPLKNGKPIAVVHLGIGTVDASMVEWMRVMKFAVQRHADSMALVHNHPSGEITPSKEDIDIAKMAARLMDDSNIKFIGHIIIEGNEFGFIHPEGDFEARKLEPRKLSQERVKIIRERLIRKPFQLEKIKYTDEAVRYIKRLVDPSASGGMLTALDVRQKIVGNFPIKSSLSSLELTQDVSRRLALVNASAYVLAFSEKSLPSERVLKNTEIALEDRGGFYRIDWFVVKGSGIYRPYPFEARTHGGIKNFPAGQVGEARDLYKLAESESAQIDQAVRQVAKELGEERISSQETAELSKALRKGFVTPEGKPPGTPPVIPTGRALAIVPKPGSLRDIPLRWTRATSEVDIQRAAQFVDGKFLGWTNRTIVQPVIQADVRKVAKAEAKRKEFAALSKGIRADSLGDQKILRGLEDRLLFSDQLTPAEQALTEKIRDFYKTAIEQDINPVLESLGKKPIPQRKNYSPHIPSLNFLADLFGGLENVPEEVMNSIPFLKDILEIPVGQRDPSLPQAIRDLPYIPRNPSAFFLKPRLGGPFRESALAGLNAYIEGWARITELYPVVHQVKPYLDFTPHNFKIVAEQWLGEVLGKRPSFDSRMDRVALSRLRSITNLSSRSLILGRISTVLLQYSSLANTAGKHGWLYTLRGYRRAVTPQGMAFARLYSRELQQRIRVGTLLEANDRLTRIANAALELTDQQMVATAFLAAFEDYSHMDPARFSQLAGTEKSFQSVLTLANISTEQTQASMRKMLNSPVLRSKVLKAIAGQLQAFNVNFRAMEFIDPAILAEAGSKKEAALYVARLNANLIVMNMLYGFFGLRPPTDFSDFIPLFDPFTGAVPIGPISKAVESRGRFVPAAVLIGVAAAAIVYDLKKDGKLSKDTWDKLWKVIWLPVPMGSQIQTTLQGAKESMAGGRISSKNPNRYDYRINSPADVLKSVTVGSSYTSGAKEYQKRKSGPSKQQLMDRLRKLDPHSAEAGRLRQQISDLRSSKERLNRSPQAPSSRGRGTGTGGNLFDGVIP